MKTSIGSSLPALEAVIVLAILTISTRTSMAFQAAETSPPTASQAAPGEATTAPAAPGLHLETGATHFSPAIEDVLKLSKASVKPEVILAYIKNQPHPFNPSAVQVIALKEAGVPSEVLEAMLAHRPQARPTIAQAPRSVVQAQPQSMPAYSQPQTATAPAYVPTYDTPSSSVYVIPYPTTYNYLPYNYGYAGWASYNYWPSYGFGCWPYYSTWGRCNYYGRPYYHYGYPSHHGYGRPAGYHNFYGAGHAAGTYSPRVAGGYRGGAPSFSRGTVSHSFQGSGRPTMSARSYGGPTVARATGGFRGGGGGGGVRMGHR